MDKILVTGASGFLGGRVCEALSRRYRVLAPDSRELDVTDRGAVRRWLLEHRPEAVVHCAAISDVGRCQREPELARRVNVEGCIHLAEVCGELGSRCVLCSSDQVYFGSTETEPHRETEVLCPANVYGAGKLAAEEGSLARNPDCVLLRLSWMYDSRTLRAGEHGDFLRTLLPKLETGEELRFPIHDRRGITDVWEVVSGLERALDLPGGVYNFGSAGGDSTYGLMRRVFRRLGLEEGRIAPDRTAFADRPRNLCMDQKKAEAHGLRFSTTEDGLVGKLSGLL